jgi:hypothetical protein
MIREKIAESSCRSGNSSGFRDIKFGAAAILPFRKGKK